MHNIHFCYSITPKIQTEIGSHTDELSIDWEILQDSNFKCWFCTSAGPKFYHQFACSGLFY